MGTLIPNLGISGILVEFLTVYMVDVQARCLTSPERCLVYRSEQQGFITVLGRLPQ